MGGLPRWARARRSLSFENSRFSGETRSRSYAKLFWSFVFLVVFLNRDGIQGNAAGQTRKPLSAGPKSICLFTAAAGVVLDVHLLAAVMGDVDLHGRDVPGEPADSFQRLARAEKPALRRFQKTLPELCRRRADTFPANAMREPGFRFAQPQPRRQHMVNAHPFQDRRGFVARQPMPPGLTKLKLGSVFSAERPGAGPVFVGSANCVRPSTPLSTHAIKPPLQKVKVYPKSLASKYASLCK